MKLPQNPKNLISNIGAVLLVAVQAIATTVQASQGKPINYNQLFIVAVIAIIGFLTGREKDLSSTSIPTDVIGTLEQSSPDIINEIEALFMKYIPSFEEDKALADTATQAAADSTIKIDKVEGDLNIVKDDLPSDIADKVDDVEDVLDDATQKVSDAPPDEAKDQVAPTTKQVALDDSVVQAIALAVTQAMNTQKNGVKA